MRRESIPYGSLTVVTLALFLGTSVFAQAPPQPRLPVATVKAPPAIPADIPGVYLHDAAQAVWMTLLPTRPVSMQVKHEYMSSMTLGAVPVPFVAVFKGAHAQMKTRDPQPVFAVVNLLTPGAPLLVRLKEKKNSRELDGGKIRDSIILNVYTATAQPGDLVPLLATNWGYGVELLQPKTSLASGEYALMFGSTNLKIYPFTVR